MSRKSLYAVVAGLGATAIVALALLLGIFQPGPADVTGGGYREGIQVHGHWTIEVRDPDSGLVERREFDNALSPNADTVLARILAGISTVGHWQLVIDSSVSGNGPCGQACLILESSAPGAGSNLFKTLAVTAPFGGNINVGKLVFSGSATATNNGQINVVRTVNAYCEPTLAPSTNCVGATSGAFNNAITIASISPAVSVSVGQQILVTVVIGFS